MPFLLFTHIHMSAPDKCHPSTSAPSYAPHNDPDESVHNLPSSAVLLRSHPASALPMSLQEQRSTAYANSLHNQVRSVLLSVHHNFRDFPENNSRHCRLSLSNLFRQAEEPFHIRNGSLCYSSIICVVSGGRSSSTRRPSLRVTSRCPPSKELIATTPAPAMMGSPASQ